MKPLNGSENAILWLKQLARSLVFFAVGFSVISLVASCGREPQPSEGSKLHSSITLDKSRGLNPDDVVAVQKILIGAAGEGEADIPLAEIFKLVRMSPEQLEVVRVNWTTPAHVVCRGWVCHARAIGTAVSVPASKDLWLPLVGYPQVKIADAVLMKFRHMSDDKTIEFCSISGVSITGFSLHGAVMVVDGDDSSFTPFFSPSWAYPSRDCDF